MVKKRQLNTHYTPLLSSDMHYAKTVKKTCIDTTQAVFTPNPNCQFDQKRTLEPNYQQSHKHVHKHKQSHKQNQQTQKDTASQIPPISQPSQYDLPYLGIPTSPIALYFNRYPTLLTYANQILHWDTRLCIRINRYSHNGRIAQFFKVISRLGDGWFWYTMLLVVAVTYGKSALIPLLTTTLISLVGLIIYKLLKIKTVRPRPYQVHQVIVLGERPLDVFSFPSGHTLQAVLFTTTLGSYYPQLLWVMLPFMLCVALSRMVLGLHYPTDVVVGAMIGYLLASCAPLLASFLLSIL